MYFLFLLHFCVNVLVVSNEVITLIKDNSITCVLTNNSINSGVYISSSDQLIDVNRTIQEISNITDWTVSNEVINFAPITDQRWTDFRNIDISKIPKLKNVLMFSFCRSNKTSIKITKSDVPHEINFTIPFEINTYPNFCQWNHFILKKHFNDFSSQNTSSQGNITLLNATKDIIDTKNILEDISLVTATSEVKYVKLHNYSFFIARNVSANKTPVNVNNWKCFSLYVSIDKDCYLNISLETGNQVVEEWQIKGFNNIGGIKMWKQFTYPLKEFEAKFLTFQRIRNDNKIDGFWAIDEIRECNSELVVYKQTVQNSTGLLNYTCKTLESINPILSNKACNSSQTIGTICNIKCREILGPSASNCEKHKICIENNCYCAWGYRGDSCDTRCDEEENCECKPGCKLCDYMKRCAECKDNYFGTNCEEKLPTVKRPPELIDLGENYIQLKLFLEYGNDEKPPNFYVIEYKKFNSSENFHKLERYPYTLVKTNIINTTLSRTASYQIRILLEIDHEKSYKKNIPELIIYPQSLHTKINDDNTITLTWNKPHNVSFEKYILEFKCSSFCPNSDLNKTLYETSYTTKINSLPCNIKLFIVADNNKLIDTTVISRNTFPISDEELPSTIELNKDKILFNMEACESFKEPLDYIAVITCLDSWCKDKNSTTKLSFKNYNKTLAKQIENLYPYTLYEINVTAKRFSQKDKQHTYSNIRSSPSKPEQVKHLDIYNVEENVIAIKWLADYPPKGKIEKYSINLVDNNGFVIESSNSTRSCELWDNYTCGNLTIPTLLQNYNISVSGKNYNVTEWSTPVFESGIITNVTTPPRNLEAVFNNFSKILFLSWEHPFYVYGKIDWFLIEVNNKSFKEKIAFYQKKYNKTINIQYEKSYNITVCANSGSNSSKVNILYTPDVNQNYNLTLTLDTLTKTFIISVVTVIIITLVILCIICICRKRKTDRKTQNYLNEPIVLSKLIEKAALLERNSNYISSHPIGLYDLEMYLISSFGEDSEDNDITRQFEALPQSKITDFNVGRLQENICKNRYKNIFPYDDTRVVLRDNENSDYINANYINGYKVLKEFIATQAPLESTVDDFWHMVCQEKVEVIVMLTELRENGKIKCEKYWPDQKSKFRYGKFLIENLSTHVTPHYILTNLLVTYHEEKHFVQHYQYMTWPDHGIPQNIQDFTIFLQEIMNIPRNSPMIVHCNAGCGRTGVFILCNICIEMGINEKRVDFLKVLKEIRDQRSSLIFNVNQYIFCHFVIVEHFFGQNFSIKISDDFQNNIKNALTKNSLNNLMFSLQKAIEQHKKLCCKPKICLSDEEKLKNRFPTILPGYTQIFLPISITNNSNYINAIAVDCYRSPKKFIVTQQPLPNTIEDFWKIIKEYEIKTIISLNQILEDDPLCPIFWPDDSIPEWKLNDIGKLTFLKNSKKHHIYNIIKLKFQSQPNCTRIVHIVDVKIWKRETLQPSNVEDLISVWKKIMTSSGTIAVTCYDGATASGLFVALAHLLEKINMEHCCDVYDAVKSVQKTRPEFVEHIEQLKFLYHAAVKYIEEFSTYDNFM